MVSKAFLIYQKFLAPNAYIAVNVTPALVEKVKEVVENSMKSISEGQEINLNVDLFDEICFELEEKLALLLFQPFFKSRF